jgi:hypothetical protein
LGLNNQVPAVCGAIGAEKSLEIFGASQVKRTGAFPSTTTEWVFELKPEKLVKEASKSTFAAVWKNGCFHPLATPPLAEGQRVSLILSSAEPQASAGGRFAAFAGTLSKEEALQMRQDIDREFGRIEGDW